MSARVVPMPPGYSRDEILAAQVPDGPHGTVGLGRIAQTRVRRPYHDKAEDITVDVDRLERMRDRRVPMAPHRRQAGSVRLAALTWLIGAAVAFLLAALPGWLS